MRLRTFNYWWLLIAALGVLWVGYFVLLVIGNLK
jgi:hypothetical protein